MRSIRGAWKGASTFIEHRAVLVSSARVSAPAPSRGGLGTGRVPVVGHGHGLRWKRVYGPYFSLSWHGFKLGIGSDDLPRVLLTRIILQF